MSKNKLGSGRLFSLLPGGGSAGLTSLELCAGGGGQALGIERAGFHHIALIDMDPNACATLHLNRPHWNVLRGDISRFDGLFLRGKVDLFAAGVPCPPFSRAGRQLGEADPRNLWPAAIQLIKQIRPRAIMIENVRGIMDGRFDAFRSSLLESLSLHGYKAWWNVLLARDFGVSQVRPRAVLVAINELYADAWAWPEPLNIPAVSVGEKLLDLIKANGWNGAETWARRATRIAPTIVGGSHRHGGPDLGPSRARQEWAEIGIDGRGIADDAPSAAFVGMPRLTLRMVARLQGFPDSWQFSGGKTATYRQIGNAFPPQVSEAIAGEIRRCLLSDNHAKACA